MFTDFSNKRTYIILVDIVSQDICAEVHLTSLVIDSKQIAV